MEERLQKVMARAGIGSRRTCEGMIRQGRVTVDGERATLGQKADPSRQRIVVDGQPLSPPEPLVYIALYKPKGILSVSKDDRGRRTVRDLIPASGLTAGRLAHSGPAAGTTAGYLFPVGRLDAPSEGLVLLTNNGALADRLTHPRYEHTKEYRVLVDGHPSEETLAKWRQGVFLDGKKTAPAQVALLRQAYRRGHHEEGATTKTQSLRPELRPRGHQDHQGENSVSLSLREAAHCLCGESLSNDDTWLRVVLREGRKRQIRRVAEMLGHPVKQLIRVCIGPVHMGDLKPGEWRYLTQQEIKALTESVK